MIEIQVHSYQFSQLIPKEVWSGHDNNDYKMNQDEGSLTDVALTVEWRIDETMRSNQIIKQTNIAK